MSILHINGRLKFKVEKAVVVFGHPKLEHDRGNLGVKSIMQWSCDDREQQGSYNRGL